MKSSVKILLVIVIAFLFSCEKQVYFIEDARVFLFNCADCTAVEPSKGNLEININKDYPGAVIINVYEGKLEDSVLYNKFISSEPSNSVLVFLNKEYTATATYNISGKRYIVVDSAVPRVKYEKKQCNDPCYVVYDKILDLRLKSSVR